MLNPHFPESIGASTVIARVVIASKDLAIPEIPGPRRQRPIGVKYKLFGFRDPNFESSEVGSVRGADG